MSLTNTARRNISTSSQAFIGAITSTGNTKKTNKGRKTDKHIHKVHALRREGLIDKKNHSLYVQLKQMCILLLEVTIVAHASVALSHWRWLALSNCSWSMYNDLHAPVGWNSQGPFALKLSSAHWKALIDFLPNVSSLKSHHWRRVFRLVWEKIYPNCSMCWTQGKWSLTLSPDTIMFLCPATVGSC